MRTELVPPSQVEPNNRLLIDNRLLRVVLTPPVGMIQTRIDHLDESARPGTLVVGPLDNPCREVHRD